MQHWRPPELKLNILLMSHQLDYTLRTTVEDPIAHELKEKLTLVGDMCRTDNLSYNIIAYNWFCNYCCF